MKLVRIRLSPTWGLPVVVALLTGCAGMGSDYRPIVDMRGVDAQRFEADLRDCQAYATQASGAGQTAAVGAVGGALLGGVLAAAGRSHDVAASARVGAVTGAVGGGATGERDQRSVIRRCMAGRGYQVLN